LSRMSRSQPIVLGGPVGDPLIPPRP
jgi:hypothetical protein